MSILIQSGSNSRGYVTSKEMLMTYIHNMAKADIRKLLRPVKDGLLTENTMFHMNTQNFSVDHVIVPISITDFLKELDPEWLRWIHKAPGDGDLEERRYAPHANFDYHGDHVDSDVILDYVTGMDKQQKRALLNLIREGVLTDECFINISTHVGPERVQVPMGRVVDAMRIIQEGEQDLQKEKPTFLKIFTMKHYSSASFENHYRAGDFALKKSKRISFIDLKVRSLTAARYTMPIWYTILFSLMTLATFASHIWSQVTNFEGLQEALSMALPTVILVLSSLLIGMLLYFNIYMVGFLCCCENNFSNHLVTKDLDYSALYVHFCELNKFQYRIYCVKGLQFILLWYTMLLAAYAHEHDLNIYPALVCVLTNGFGLMLFARMAEFFRRCRKTRDRTAIAAR
ncbi:Protein CBG17339 [Caenorhabditis briggsae]|uniref:Protein CBG17339 n=1 Tax=Caenorhabditis briggsae TaxID=6238 RepID=A8XQU8_CAEBR|nr:Protein CBG17339 [Caenorhabditis briggsae]CAP35023.2 Protein CBG17339 [Caenorhabditis briggsae]